MKKTALILLIAIMAVSLFACGNKETATTETPKTLLQAENVTIEYVMVDDSYRDSDNSSRRAVYVFMNLHPTASNIKSDCKFDLIVDNTNTYTAEILPGSLCEYAPAYYYDRYLEETFVGETRKAVATFLIPEGDLTSGKKITFSDSDITDLNTMFLFTDDIKHENGDDAVCKIADPKGYEEISYKYEPASSEVVTEVQSLITDKYWEAYVNPLWYCVYFTAPNFFTVKTSLGENSGTYTVQNGYLFCTYDSNDATIKIPYEIVEGEGVHMDLTETFK